MSSYHQRTDIFRVSMNTTTLKCSVVPQNFTPTKRTMVVNCERVFKHFCEKSKSETVNQYCSVCMLRRDEKDFFRGTFYLLCVRTDHIFGIERKRILKYQVNFFPCVINHWNICLKLAQVETSYHDRSAFKE